MEFGACHQRTEAKIRGGDDSFASYDRSVALDTLRQQFRMLDQVTWRQPFFPDLNPSQCTDNLGLWPTPPVKHRSKAVVKPSMLSPVYRRETALGAQNERTRDDIGKIHKVRLLWRFCRLAIT